MAQDRTSTLSSPLFVGITPDDRDAIVRRATLRKFGPGESLFAQGKSATALFVVTRGRIKIWRAAEDGTPLTLALLGPGAPIGTLGAAKDVRNHATVSAITAVEALVWPLRGLREAMDSNATLALNVLRTVSTYAEQMIERLEEVSSVPVEQRLARTLLRMAQGSYGDPAQDGCDLPLSRQDLADLTSATLPTVSRIMSRWKQAGLIAGGRGRVRLLDCEELRLLSERATG
ncbi:Crp/Fnr family transcriptional regulator [Sphingomonas sp.]|uniref:Crp/Fnr family transcriptional regulator n=1 Tax=Sphingomonas sp. TaxID=28214 RepID=UPI003B3A9C14